MIAIYHLKAEEEEVEVEKVHDAINKKQREDEPEKNNNIQSI
jgi:hypothetical protein